MNKIAPEIARQIRAIREGGSLPVSITMNFDTKCAMLRQMTERQRGQYFRPAPISSGDPDKFAGLPILIEFDTPNGEVRVA